MDIYFKQKDLFNPEDSQPRIHVYGCGSVGSHTVVGLVKTGFRNITVYDYDQIEAENIPAQFFRNNTNQLTPLGWITGTDIGKDKVDAIKDICMNFSNHEINIRNEMVTESTNLDLSNKSIHVLAFDTIEGRKIIIEKLEGFPVMLIDSRIGAFDYSLYTIDCSDNNQVKRYKETLEGEFVELTCGSKCLWAVNSLVSANIISYILRITKGMNIPACLEGCLLSEVKIVKNKWEE